MSWLRSLRRNVPRECETRQAVGFVCRKLTSMEFRPGFIHLLVLATPAKQDVVVSRWQRYPYMKYRWIDPVGVHSQKDLAGHVIRGTPDLPRGNQQRVIKLMAPLKFIGLLADQHPIDGLNETAR